MNKRALAVLKESLNHRRAELLASKQAAEQGITQIKGIIDQLNASLAEVHPPSVQAPLDLSLLICGTAYSKRIAREVHNETLRLRSMQENVAELLGQIEDLTRKMDALEKLKERIRHRAAGQAAHHERLHNDELWLIGKPHRH